MNSNEKKDLIKQLTFLKRRKEIDARPNTWEWVDSIRREILTDTDNYPWRSACEELWESVSDFQDDKYLNIKRDDVSGNHPIECLNYWLEIPRYPPLEVLLAISEAFDIYMAAGGALTLEDVFFGPTKKGVGNYSARKSREDTYKNFHMYISLDNLESKHKGEKPRDLESLATDYLMYGKNPMIAKALKMEPNYDCKQDPESFLRAYRRWKKEAKNNIKQPDK